MSQSMQRSQEPHWTAALILSLSFLVWSCGDDGAGGGPPIGPNDGDARVTAGPYVQQPTPDSVEIRWETDLETSSVVLWGETESLGRWAQGRILEEDYSEAYLVKPRPGFRHSVKIEGLEPGKVYHYQVEPKSKSPGEGVFAAALAADEPFKLIVYGDTRTNYKDHKAVVDAIIDESPDLAVHLGDLVENATKDDLWDDFFEIETPLLKNVPMYPVLGNHEFMIEGFFKYRTIFGPYASTGKLRYYSFDYGTLHGVVLDTESPPYQGTEQRNWLEQDLAEASGRQPAPVIMVFFHKPLFTFSGVRKPDYKLRAELEPLFKEHGVAAVMWGHEHCYEHYEYNGIHQVTSGGGGAPLSSLKQPSGDDAQYWVKGQSTYHYIRLDVSPGGYDAEVVRIPDLALIDTFSHER